MEEQTRFPFGSNETLVRNTDPETSREAAEELRASGRLGELQGRVLDMGRSQPGLTINEYWPISGLDKVCISPRFAELRRAALIEDRGKKVDRLTGRPCLCWWPVQRE